MLEMKLGTKFLIPISLFFSLTACANEVPGISTSKSFGVTVLQRDQGAEAIGGGAQFWNNLIVIAGGDQVITSEEVIDALMTRNVTGYFGLCIQCTSSTPEFDQNIDNEAMHAEHVSPIPVPGFFTGTVNGHRSSATEVRATMENVFMTLNTAIEAEQLEPNKVYVKERGETYGAAAVSFSEGHLKYFELATALSRAINRQ